MELTVEPRAVSGKKVKMLRAQGFVPAVVYGHGMTAQSIMASAPQMTKTYRAAGKHHPVELQLGKQKHLAMIKSADIDPVKHSLRHVSFQAISQNEPVETEVPITITGLGETPAEKAGLIILTNVDTVEISALPADLPDSIALDGEKLIAEGDRLTITDLLVPKGVTVLSEPEQVVATVWEPGALAAQNEAAAGESETAEASAVEAENGGQATDENAAGDQKEA